MRIIIEITEDEKFITYRDGDKCVKVDIADDGIGYALLVANKWVEGKEEWGSSLPSDIIMYIGIDHGYRLDAFVRLVAHKGLVRMCLIG